MYTQSLYILCHEPISPDELGARLRRMNVLGRHQPLPSDHWSRNCDGWNIQYAGHPRGRVVVDTVPHPWPDAFNRDDDASLYAAWSMGFFGPRVEPGCLKRAIQRIAPSLLDSVLNHTGFVRLRMSYIPESGAPLIPPDRIAQDELAYLTRAAYFVLEDDAAFALFCPSGEVLTADRQVWQIYDRSFGESHRMWRLWIGAHLHADGESEHGIQLTGMPALAQREARLIFDPNCIEDKDALLAAKRLIDTLGADVDASHFSDKKKREWRRQADRDDDQAVFRWVQHP